MLSAGTGVVARLGCGDCRELSTRRNDERWMRDSDVPVQRSSLAGRADRLVMRVVRRCPAGIDVGRVAEPRTRLTERGNADGKLRHQRQEGGSAQKDRAERGSA